MIREANGVDVSEDKLLRAHSDHGRVASLYLRAGLIIKLRVVQLAIVARCTAAVAVLSFNKPILFKLSIASVAPSKSQENKFLL